MDEFPGNSNKEKEAKKPVPRAVKAEKKIERVIKGDVVKRKKPFSDRFRGVFFGADFRSTTSYILTEVLLPALKNLMVDATSKGVERVVYGESSRRRPMQGQTGPRIQYHNPSSRFMSRGGPMLPDQPPLQRRPTNSASDILLQSRDEAQEVLENLVEIIDTYNVASMADLNALVGLPTTYVDNKWGWTNLQYATVRQTREGYLLDLPPVEAID